MNIAEREKTLRVVGVNSPATSQIKTELPGSDPTSLYYALVFDAKKRFQNGESQIQILNPKIWNKDSIDEFTEKLSGEDQDVFLISNTSPGHPYSVEIGKLLRVISPGSITILGGPHEDETMRVKSGELILEKGSTILDMLEETIPPVFDFVFAGDGEYVVPALLKIVEDVSRDSLGKNIKEEVILKIKENSSIFNGISGKGMLAWLNEDKTVDWVQLSGKPISLLDVPFIYDYFPNNSRFDVFPGEDGTPKRTAHIMTSRGCINSCLYCSESVKVLGRNITTKENPEKKIKDLMENVKTVIDKGSEAIFFEDSIFMLGNVDEINLFCSNLRELRDRKDFEWGCQMTVEEIIGWGENAEEVLKNMYEAGCSYIFFGIESMSEQVMGNIGKHKKRKKIQYVDWSNKVRSGLELVKSIGFKTGASVLFGLPGENESTINHTISSVANLIDDKLLDMVSPNLATYHPGTRLTRESGSEVNYHTISPNIPPYCYFEEADPARITKALSVDQIEDIWIRINVEWKTLNRDQTKI